MHKVQKHNSFNTNTPSSESYRNYLCPCMSLHAVRNEISLQTNQMTLGIIYSKKF